MSATRRLADKFRRALRNDTGTSFSADELRQLGDMGLLDLITAAETRELSRKWAGSNNGYTQSEGSGLPSVPMAAPHITRSAGMTRRQRQLGVKALVARG